MKKITQNRLNLSTGKVEIEEQKIKIKNFSEGDAATCFRQWLIEKGYSKDIGSVILDKHTYGKLQYLTLFGKPIKCHFTLWLALKDTKTGKATFWLGEENSTKQEQVDYGIIVNNRIIPNDVFWHCLIVTPRDTFRIGTSFKNQDFLEILLLSLKDIIEEVKLTNQGYITIKKSHREKFAFDKMIEQFKTSEDLL